MLPNYRFLSLGRSGMRFKMDYVPTLALVASIFFIVLLLFFKKNKQLFPLYCSQFASFCRSPSPLFNGLHMSTKSGCGTAMTKRCFSFFPLLGQIIMFCLRYTISALCQPTCPNRTIWTPIYQSPRGPFCGCLAVVIKETLLGFFSSFPPDACFSRLEGHTFFIYLQSL